MAVCIVVAPGYGLPIDKRIPPGDELISVLYERRDEAGKRFEFKSHPTKRKDAKREIDYLGHKWIAIGHWEFCGVDDRLTRLK